MAKLQVPGLGQIEPQSFRPLHGHQRPCSACLFLLLKKQFIGGGRLLQAIEIKVHQLWLPLGVVLGQCKGGAGDRFADPEALGQALHQRCFAGAKGPAQQQDGSRWKLARQQSAQGPGRLKGLKRPDMPCRVRLKRARSLGVSAEIQLHVLLGSTETMVAAPTSPAELKLGVDCVIADINQADFGRKELDIAET